MDTHFIDAMRHLSLYERKDTAEVFAFLTAIEYNKRKDKGMSETKITYSNKDLVSKYFVDLLEDKTLDVYGIHIPRIKKILPTNLPVIWATELRIDNLFLLEDGSIAIFDYESVFKPANISKYVRYIVQVLVKYKIPWDLQQIRMIVIYTGNVARQKTSYSVGSLTVNLEAAYLGDLDTERIHRCLQKKIEAGEALSDTDMMEFVIYPLAYPSKKQQNRAISEAVTMALHITDSEIQKRVLSGIMVFGDKIIDAAMKQHIKEVLEMTKMAEWLMEDGIAIGRKEGEEVGRREGERIGRKAGERIGRKEGEKVGCELGDLASMIKVLRNAAKNEQSIYVAADLLELPHDRADYLVRMIQKNLERSDMELARKLQKGRRRV
jgi:hypothetical protein